MLKTHIEELDPALGRPDGVRQPHGQLHARPAAASTSSSQARVLPGYEDSWERVLVAIEDVTERENARRWLAISEHYARGLFEHSPVSLWVEDFSSVKRLLDEVREQRHRDFRVFTDVHPEFVQRCMSEIRVIDVNRHTLDLFGAPDKPTLLQPPRRRVPRRHGAAFPRAAHRPVGRQAVPAARGGELRARRQRAARPPAVLGAAGPRATTGRWCRWR